MKLSLVLITLTLLTEPAEATGLFHGLYGSATTSNAEIRPEPTPEEMMAHYCEVRWRKEEVVSKEKGCAERLLTQHPERTTEILKKSEIEFEELPFQLRLWIYLVNMGQLHNCSSLLNDCEQAEENFEKIFEFKPETE